MIDLSIFKGGEYRVFLPLYELVPVILFAPTLLTLLITRPTQQISTPIKQILSIPLLLFTFFAPFGFNHVNRVIQILTMVNHSVFLRFFELFWIGPIIQHRDAYCTASSLWIDVWSCIRVFPKPAKEDTKDLKKGEVKQYKKDKKFYHIIIHLVKSAILVDVISSWISTITPSDVEYFMKEKPFFYYFFFLSILSLLFGAFNIFGGFIHLFYCLAFEGGSYSSEQYRPLIYNPLMSETLNDLWSNRWHSLFKSTWLAFPFRSVRILSLRFLNKKVKDPKKIAFILASLSVFFASANMHEYMIASSVGWPIYSRHLVGEQTFFFMIHGFGVVLEHLVQGILSPRLSTEFKNSTLLRLLKFVWVSVFGYYTIYYIVNGFFWWGFHHDIPLLFTQPLMRKAVSVYPPLREYFGSLF